MKILKSIHRLVALAAMTPVMLSAQEPATVEGLFEEGASLMGEGDLEGAQARFDRAFSMKDAEKSEAYPYLVNEQGTLMTWRGERAAAIAMKRKAMKSLAKVGDGELDISVYSDLGLLYHRSNMTDSAVWFYERADSAARAFGDAGWLASVTQNIGVMYFNLSRFDDAERYLERAAEYGEDAGDDYSAVCSLQLLASAELESGKTEAGGENARRAWTRAEASGDERLMLRCIPALYGYFEAVGKADSVDHYMAVGEKIYGKLPPNSVISLGYVGARARMHYNRNEWGEALRWSKLQMDSPMQNDRAALLKRMADCYRGLGRYDEACVMLDSALVWTDSLARVNAAASLEELNVKYRTLERERDNAELRLGVLWRDRMLLAVALGAVLLAVLLISLCRRHRAARRAVEEMKRRRELESSLRYIDGLESERKRFAKELHDGVANDLLGLKMRIEAGAGVESVAGDVDRLRLMVRRISHDLMPPQFEEMTLEALLGAYVDELRRDAGLDAVFETSGEIPAVTPGVGREVYRIVQELLMNILNHGNATHVNVAMSPADGRVELSICDNSTVEMKPADACGDGIGLRTVADRVKAIGAQSTSSKDENGCNRFVLVFDPE